MVLTQSEWVEWWERLGYIFKVVRAFRKMNHDVFESVINEKVNELTKKLAEPNITDADRQRFLQQRRDWPKIKILTKTQNEKLEEFEEEHLGDANMVPIKDRDQWLADTEQAVLDRCRVDFNSTLNRCMDLDPGSRIHLEQNDIVMAWLVGSWEQVKEAMAPILNSSREELIGEPEG
jgi:hypothetical protein